jgi:hypothetical protein
MSKFWTIASTPTLSGLPMLSFFFMTLIGCGPSPASIEFEQTEIFRYNSESFDLQSAIVKDEDGNVIPNLEIEYRWWIP